MRPAIINDRLREPLPTICGCCNGEGITPAPWRSQCPICLGGCTVPPGYYTAADHLDPWSHEADGIVPTSLFGWKSKERNHGKG